MRKKNVELFLGIPPVLYLILNKTIRNETHKQLSLKLFGVNMERLSQQTRDDLTRVARMQTYYGEDEMIEQAAPTWHSKA